MGLGMVTNLDEVRAGIRQFNSDLEHSAGLAARLKMIRAWYYDPEIDMVGPSKFIGYTGMTAEHYLHRGRRTKLDGRETEPVLGKWFRVLEAGSPEEAMVRARAEKLLGQYGKTLNEAVRFCGPISWKITGKEAAVRPSVHATRGRRTIHATIIRGETQYVAECEQLAVVTQGMTIDETIQNLREAVELHLEGEDLSSLGLAPDPVILVSMELQPWAA